MAQVGTYSQRAALIDSGFPGDDDAVAVNTAQGADYVAGHLAFGGFFEDYVFNARLGGDYPGNDIFSLGRRNLTISLWFQYDPDTTEPRQYLQFPMLGAMGEVNEYNNYGADLLPVDREDYTMWAIRPLFAQDDSSIQLDFIYKGEHSPASNLWTWAAGGVVPGPVILLTGEPIFLAVTFELGLLDPDNTRVTVYANAVPGPTYEVAKTKRLHYHPNGNGDSGNNAKLLLGATFENVVAPSKGMVIDAIALFPSALTAARVLDYYRQGLGQAPTGEYPTGPLMFSTNSVSLDSPMMYPAVSSPGVDVDNQLAGIGSLSADIVVTNNSADPIHFLLGVMRGNHPVPSTLQQFWDGFDGGDPVTYGHIYGDRWRNHTPDMTGLSYVYYMVPPESAAHPFYEDLDRDPDTDLSILDAGQSTAFRIYYQSMVQTPTTSAVWMFQSADGVTLQAKRAVDLGAGSALKWLFTIASLDLSPARDSAEYTALPRLVPTAPEKFESRSAPGVLGQFPSYSVVTVDVYKNGVFDFSMQRPAYFAAGTGPGAVSDPYTSMRMVSADAYGPDGWAPSYVDPVTSVPGVTNDLEQMFLSLLGFPDPQDVPTATLPLASYRAEVWAVSYAEYTGNPADPMPVEIGRVKVSDDINFTMQMPPPP
jgi:hypothetical protein